MATPRRSFLKSVFGIVSAVVAASVVGPIAVAFLDPARRRTVVGGTGPMRMGKLADLAVGVPRKRDVVSAGTDAWDRSDPRAIGVVWLIRRAGDKVDAYSGICPHLGCPVNFDHAQDVFVCPCHDSAFAKLDGARLKGPAPRGLDPLPVAVKDGEVEVTYRQFVQGISSRREA